MTNTLITIGISIIFTLIGVIWNSLNQRIKALEKRINEVDKGIKQTIKDAVTEAFKEIELIWINQGRIKPLNSYEKE